MSQQKSQVDSHLLVKSYSWILKTVFRVENQRYNWLLTTSCQDLTLPRIAGMNSQTGVTKLSKLDYNLPQTKKDRQLVRTSVKEMYKRKKLNGSSCNRLLNIKKTT